MVFGQKAPAKKNRQNPPVAFVRGLSAGGFLPEAFNLEPSRYGTMLRNGLKSCRLLSCSDRYRCGASSSWTSVCTAIETSA